MILKPLCNNKHYENSNSTWIDEIKLFFLLFKGLSLAVPEVMTKENISNCQTSCTFAFFSREDLLFCSLFNCASNFGYIHPGKPSLCPRALYSAAGKCVPVFRWHSRCAAWPPWVARSACQRPVRPGTRVLCFRAKQQLILALVFAVSFRWVMYLSFFSRW